MGTILVEVMRLNRDEPLNQIGTFAGPFPSGDTPIYAAKWLHLTGCNLVITELARDACYQAMSYLPSKAQVSFDPNIRPEVSTVERDAVSLPKQVILRRLASRSPKWTQPAPGMPSVGVLPSPSWMVSL